MEPFQLICQSCAAKLKVKNPSAIGQRLACPKCRQMILVEAPDGHEIRESNGPTSSFENMDLDSILENKPAVPRKPKGTSPQPPAPRKQKPTAEIILTPPKSAVQPPVTAKPDDQQEITPADNWVNPATRKKQRLVLTVMAAVGALLVLGAIVFAAISLDRGDSEPNVSEKNDAATNGVATVDDKSRLNGETHTKTVEGSTIPDTPLADTPLNTDPDTSIADDPPSIEIPDTPPDIAANIDETNSEPETPEKIALPGTDGSDFARADDESEKLRQILAESGTSLLALQGAAANVRSFEHIGTPKYFFEKLSIPELNFNRAKDQALLEVNYDNQPLQTVLHELSAISGLVLAIDVPALNAASLEPNPNVTLNAKDQSTADIIRAVARSVNLVARETDNGFWVSTQTTDNRTDREFDVRALARDEVAGQRLIEIIKRTVYPESWRTEDVVGQGNSNEGKGTIEYADGTLKVNHRTTVSMEVTRVIEAILSLDDDTPLHPLRQPVPSLDSGSFSKPFGKRNSLRIPFSSFEKGISNDSGIQIFVDWHSLYKAGWTPGSLAPGIIEESTVGDVIRETAHGMGVSVFLVNDSTAWLSSPEVVASIFDLKIYRIDALAAGKLTPPRLAQILQNSLGNQLFQPGVAIELLPGEEFALVRAPQSLHYQFSAVISELEKSAE